MRRREDARIEFEFVRATEVAAIAVDRAAVDAMHLVLGDVDVAGTVVIGESEKDEAPMLYIGEELETGYGPASTWIKSWSVPPEAVSSRSGFRS